MRSALILVAYDGSPSASAALDAVARLFPQARALVATCWQSARQVAHAARVALPAGVVEQAVEKLDDAAREAAAAAAAEGAQRLCEAGVEAEAIDRAADGAPWRALAALATEMGADVVVVGSRGRSGVGSLVLGSTSHGLVYHCRVPVLVVNPDR